MRNILDKFKKILVVILNLLSLVILFMPITYVGAIFSVKWLKQPLVISILNLSLFNVTKEIQLIE